MYSTSKQNKILYFFTKMPIYIGEVYANLYPQALPVNMTAAFSAWITGNKKNDIQTNRFDKASPSFEQ